MNSDQEEEMQKLETGGLSSLGPDRVLTLVEKALDVRCNNLFRPLNSYINRVFEIETVDKERLIVKFYRPGRWSKEAIQDEHDFLLDLSSQEIPVIAPLTLTSNSTLENIGNLYFSVFPKCGGRNVDEFDDEQWLQLGRLLGRVHEIGQMRPATNRITMSPQVSTRMQLDYLLAAQCVPEELKPLLQQGVEDIIADITPLFDETKNIRLHGDCHFANVIHRPGESFYLIDFDDMVMGQAVQDLWMLLPGDLDDAFVELDLLLEGYESFRPFDRRTLKLIEPLRAMRFIHYMAWCAHQVEEDGLTKAIDGFGTREYWQKEIADLVDQRERIAEGQLPSGNML